MDNESWHDSQHAVSVWEDETRTSLRDSSLPPTKILYDNPVADATVDCLLASDLADTQTMLSTQLQPAEGLDIFKKNRRKRRYSTSSEAKPCGTDDVNRPKRPRLPDVDDVEDTTDLVGDMMKCLCLNEVPTGRVFAWTPRPTDGQYIKPSYRHAIELYDVAVVVQDHTNPYSIISMNVPDEEEDICDEFSHRVHCRIFHQPHDDNCVISNDSPYGLQLAINGRVMEANSKERIGPGILYSLALKRKTFLQFIIAERAFDPIQPIALPDSKGQSAQLDVDPEPADSQRKPVSRTEPSTLNESQLRKILTVGAETFRASTMMKALSLNLSELLFSNDTTAVFKVDCSPDPVAIKVMLTEKTSAKELVTRSCVWKNEIDCYNKLKDCDNVPQLLFHDAKNLCTVMEYVPYQHKQLQASETTQEVKFHLFVSLVNLLMLLEARGLVHCDIKPSNIGYCPDKGVKLLDWGTSGPVKVCYTMGGSSAYMPPEYHGGICGFASDTRGAALSLSYFFGFCPLLESCSPSWDITKLEAWTYSGDDFDNFQQCLRNVADVRESLNRKFAVQAVLYDMLHEKPDLRPRASNILLRLRKIDKVSQSTGCGPMEVETSALANDVNWVRYHTQSAQTQEL